MSLIRTKYFSERLEDMDNFYGFFPRTYLPQSKLYNADTSISTKVTLFFIDSRQEIKVGVGLNFPPVALDKDQI